MQVQYNRNKVFGKTSIIYHPIDRQLLVARHHDVFLYFNINMFFSWIHDKMFLADFLSDFRRLGYLLTKKYILDFRFLLQRKNIEKRAMF